MLVPLSDGGLAILPLGLRVVSVEDPLEPVLLPLLVPIPLVPVLPLVPELPVPLLPLVPLAPLAPIPLVPELPLLELPLIPLVPAPLLLLSLLPLAPDPVVPLFPVLPLVPDDSSVDLALLLLCLRLFFLWRVVDCVPKLLDDVSSELGVILVPPAGL
ncbi:MAG: hypothetical protein ACXWJK_00910 [Burkholderiaceae bacterium]